MRKEAIKQIIAVVCDGYIDTLLNGIEESEKIFPYTLTCFDFIDSLRKSNIIVVFFIPLMIVLLIGYLEKI